MRQDVLGILAGAHPAHVRIFRCFTDNVHFVLGPWMPGKKHSVLKKIFKYVFWGFLLGSKNPKVVFIEGAIPSLIIGTVIRYVSKNSFVIALVAEDAFFKAEMHPNHFKSKILKNNFNKTIDAVIAIGPMIAEQLKRFRFMGSIFLMYPEMSEKQAERFMSSSYSSGSRMILHIGGGEIKYKGVDLTIQVAKRLREYNFVILGYDKLAIDQEVPSAVSLPGRVKDVYPFLKKAALVVHLGRGDAFPVSTLEAMLAGVPVMLSKYTGTCQIMEEINPLFVRELSDSDLVKGIDWFFSLNEEIRIEYSNKIKIRIKEEMQRIAENNEKTILKIKELIKNSYRYPQKAMPSS